MKKIRLCEGRGVRRNCHLAFRATPELKAKIDKYIISNELTLSEFLEEAVIKHISKKK